MSLLCVYFLIMPELFGEGLKGTEIQTAVVAGNFPNSQTFTEIKLAECKMAIGAGAQEVDVVISVGGYSGKKL